MRALAAVENADPTAHQVSSRRRALVLAVIIVCCVVLAAWIGVLAVTLPALLPLRRLAGRVGRASTSPC